MAYAVILVVSGALIAELIRLRKRVRIHAEAAETIRKREAHFRRLIEHSEDIIAVLDPDGRMVYESRAAIHRLGFRGGRVGKNFYDFVHPEDWDAVVECLTGTRRRPGEMHAVVHRSCSAAGTWRTFESICNSRRDSQGRFVTIVNSRDITEREQAEQEARQLEVQLRRAQRLESIGTLAGGIAHDFNNILTPIVGHVDLAARRLSPTGPTMRHLAQVRRAAARASDLVQRLLTFSREVEQEQQPISPESVVIESLDLLRASIPTTIEIRTHFEPGAGTVRADPTQLQQVVFNLCTNAAHAMGARGGVLELSIDTDPGGESSGEWVRLVVRDDGPGMDRVTRERIFEPFFTTRAQEGGTGLGMAVVHGIVSGHGGSIEVESAPGQGCCVTLRLPRVRTAARESARTVDGVPRGRGRVLFVDDEPAIARLGAQMLRSLGYRVVEATHPMLALERFRAAPASFDAVVTDQTMPGLTGLELAEALLAERPDLPILLTTGFGDRLTGESVRDLGLQDLLPKPYGCHELGERLYAMLGSRGPAALRPGPAVLRDRCARRTRGADRGAAASA